LTAATDLCSLTIAESSRLIAARNLSPVELVAAHLERIDETDSDLNSFITLLAEEAVAAAAAAEAEIQNGNYRGPLHGIPIGLKDLYYTRGVRTTVGSKIMGDFVPDYDAAVVERFAEAGAVLMGKLQMHEFALGATSENPHYGPARNPRDTERVTGGSSGGSGSAVASGQCMGALGSDTGGSVRIPASLCGIVGLKPTFGLVSRYGVFPLSWSLDTVGPMTRTVEDTALIMNVIAGPDLRDPSSSGRDAEDYTAELGEGVDGTRIGIPREHFFDVLDDEVSEAVMRAAGVMEGLGASVEEVSVPMLDHVSAISGAILITEAAEVHLDNLRERADLFDPEVRARLELGALSPAVQYIKAQRARSAFSRQMLRTMARVDILLTPTCPIVAPRIGEQMVAVGDRIDSRNAVLSRLTRPFNLSGNPTVSLPCGSDSRGMPIGLQLTGRLFDETGLLRVANAYEGAGMKRAAIG
jgi:aspartyl-tRNA(Asn)/glutamyl-tRNA(Gln) amidotransferase subunit A